MISTTSKPLLNVGRWIVREKKVSTQLLLSSSIGTRAGVRESINLFSPSALRSFSSASLSYASSSPFAVLSPSYTSSSVFSFSPNSIRAFSSLPLTSDRSPPVEKIRNVAIIAHVDHGKTTLVDTLLKEAGEINSQINERVMDSNQLEMERGITIISKVTSINWKGNRLNIVDTPGHGDFGGEVERVMSMVDGVVLVVDATEGVMTQTKYVLTKALRSNLKPVVVINKMDRPSARVDEVESEIFDLFVALEATDEQLSYPTIYASAREGWARSSKEAGGSDGRSMAPILEAILEHVPQPKAKPEDPFSMIASILEYDNFVGRILTGRISSGEVQVGMKIQALNGEAKVVDEGVITKVMVKSGLEKTVLNVGGAGDIVSISGLSKATVTHTLCDPSVTKPLYCASLDPPVLKMTFSVNDSPLQGKEGSKLTASMIKDRLMKELEVNPALTVAFTGSSAFEVSGRGELHLGILIENMRREGFELTIGPPRVIYKTDEGGKKLEPVEEVIIDIEQNYLGFVMEKMSLRKAELLEIKETKGKTRMVFHCPSRCLIGFRSQFNTETRGSGTMNTIFYSYKPFAGALDKGTKGALISLNNGRATAYALNTVEDRGIMFIAPGAQVYEGMVVGEHSRDNDLEVNVTKEKQLSNMRAAGKDEAIRLTPPRVITLEEAISIVKADELIEVTPTQVRLRKLDLNSAKRKAKGKNLDF